MSELHSEASAASPAAVLVGVINHQHPEVLDTAARLATTFGLDSVCAYTVTGLVTSEWREHGGINFQTLEPDAREELGVEQVFQLQNALVRRWTRYRCLGPCAFWSVSRWLP